jgi:hypothetical protein
MSWLATDTIPPAPFFAELYKAAKVPPLVASAWRGY